MEMYTEEGILRLVRGGGENSGQRMCEIGTGIVHSCWSPFLNCFS